MDRWSKRPKAKLAKLAKQGEAVDPLDEKQTLLIPTETLICLTLDDYPDRTARAREVAREMAQMTAGVIEVSPREVRAAFAVWQRVGRIRKNPDGSYTLKQEYAESEDFAIMLGLARIAVQQHEAGPLKDT